MDDAIALAAQQGDRSTVLLLPRRRVLVIRAGRRHGFPIEFAAWYGHEGIVELLLEHGADPSPVFARGLGSLVRVRAPILARLAAAGGHAPPPVLRIIHEETGS